MYEDKVDYIGDDIRVTTRRCVDRDACSVSFVTTVEKRGSLDQWSLQDRHVNEVRANAERKHEDVRKEQEQIREREIAQRLEKEKQQELAKERELASKREKELAKQERDRLDREREEKFEKRFERERGYDRGYDRGFGR